MSKLTISRNENGEITRINGVKPFTTLLGFLDAGETSDDETYVECEYFVVCDTTGYILHSISVEIEDRFTERYDLSDLKTAFVFYNRVKDALNETLALPEQLLKKSKLMKRYNKIVDKLDLIHHGFIDKYITSFETGKNIFIENEDSLAYAEVCRQKAIKKTQMLFCGEVKEVIDDVQDMINDLAGIDLSEDTRKMHRTGMENYMNHHFCDIAAIIHDNFPCDEEARNEVLAFVVNFINSYNRIPGFEKINIEFTA